MMGGKGSGSSGPTSDSVRNGKSGTDTKVEEQSFVNPGATDPLENVDDEN